MTQMNINQKLRNPHIHQCYMYIYIYIFYFFHNKVFKIATTDFIGNTQSSGFLFSLRLM